MKTPRNLAPHDLGMERAVLGACLLDPGAFDRCVTLLSMDAFYDQRHVAIWRALEACRADGASPDLMLVRSHCSADEVPMAYLAELVAEPGATLNAAAYAQRLRVFATLRDGIRTAYAALREAATEGATPEDGIAALQQVGSRLQELTADRGESVSIGSVLPDLWRSLENPDTAPLRRVATGINTLDELLNGGFRAGNLVLVGARPGCGKSALACNTITLHAGFNGERVVLFSLEMDRVELAERMLASHARTHLSAIRNRRLAPHQKAEVLSSVAALEQLDVLFADRPGMTFRHIAHEARRLHRIRPLSLVVVDYLQLVKGTANKSGSRELEVSEISRSLKQLAKELRCPVIALSQLNRGVESRGEHAEPRVSDLRESGSLEQDADVVLLLWPLGESQPNDPAEVGCAVAKHRGGALGRAKLSFAGWHTDFTDAGPLAHGDTAPVRKVPKAAR